MILSNFLDKLLRQLSRRTRNAAPARVLEHQQHAGPEDTRRFFERILAGDPENVEAHHQVGVANAQLGRHAAAKDHLLRALELRPELTEVHIDLGNVYRFLSEPEAAEASYRKALELTPDAALAHFNLAMLLREGARPGEALTHLQRAHALSPARGDILRSLVTSLVEAQQYKGAMEVAQAAARLNPESYEARVSLGFACQKSHALVQALANYDDAMRMRSDDAELHSNRAIVLQDLGRLDEAVAGYQRALELRPGFELARFHHALACLLAGDYAHGWTDYEARLVSEGKPKRPASYPRWDGTAPEDKTILVYGEQGLGDELMFASCLPDVIRDAAHCVIECAPKLAGLFARSFPAATVFPAMPDKRLPASVAGRQIDAEVPIGSLPLHYRRDRAAFPRHDGYLKADAGRVRQWRERLGALGPGLKVGVSWRGGTHRTRRASRSIPLDAWLPILTMPDARFISLQYPAQESTDVADLSQDHGVQIKHFPEAIDDYEETAALLTALDLTISVCTAVIHLAGALGCPVWVMAPYSPEWRYGIRGEDMPWYPSARVFRQDILGQWAGVIESVAIRLNACGEKHAAPERY